ncbi:unnamed protein product [Rotaria magnacalcarata]
MERCSFDEIDNLIRSSHHSATRAITDSLIVDDATRNITDKSQNIRFDNIRDQLKIFSERLPRVEQSRSTRTISNTDSRPAASRSVQIKSSSIIWSERFQVQEGIYHLKLDTKSWVHYVTYTQIFAKIVTKHLTYLYNCLYFIEYEFNYMLIALARC